MALIDQIIGVESGGNPSARNPRSSAAGLGQFIDSTWLSMLAKYRPDLTGSKEELLALKSDPQLSKAMTEAYAAENGQILQGAGHEVTPGSTYLAHFAGPQGAVSVLNADPSAPVGQILGDRVVKANPFLANMTAGDLRAWADKKMGLSQPMDIRPPAAQGVGSPLDIRPNVAALPLPPAQAAAPIFAQPSAPKTASPSLFSQMPAEQMQAPPPIFAPPRKPIDLSKLRAALASGNRGLFL
jgi:hypothetical protein